MISGRSSAIRQAQEWISRRPVYLDTETTGLDQDSEIVEISIIDDDGKKLLDTLIKPKGRIPLEAFRLHGISDDMVAEAPGWKDIWSQVLNCTTDRTIGIYNADFDLRMMQQSLAKNFMPWQKPPGSIFVCIMKLYAQYFGEWDRRRGAYRNQSLENAAWQCRIDLQNKHRAYDDSLLARAVLHYIAVQPLK
jgi:DNA polymerase III epsilon subunit-like protein